MVSAMIGAILMGETGWPFALAFPAAMVAGGVVAVVVYFASFRFVPRDYPTASILSSLGFGLVLTAMVTKLFGSDQRSCPTSCPPSDGPWDIRRVRSAAGDSGLSAC